MLITALKTELKAGITARLRLLVEGSVQGMGFRPFVYRLAGILKLSGFVRNRQGALEIEVEGSGERIGEFLQRLEDERPPFSEIEEITGENIPLQGIGEFVILQSPQAGACASVTRILPDIATCEHCLREIFDPGNRRFRYPFTNCTLCGPRYSVIERLPYDRERTSMRHFPMCSQCHAEYSDPSNRRFHAQTNCCPDCGPQVEFHGRGEAIFSGEDALGLAVKEIRRGGILAVKGIGGFLFMGDARSDEVVRKLRERKHRPDKPFALMYPSLKLIYLEFNVSKVESAELASCRAPIVLLRDSSRRSFSSLVNPGVPYCGVMLPYSPLFSILMLELQFPVIATSGNFSEEPICIDEAEAFQSLQPIADAFLVHNRQILRRTDDSVVHETGGRIQVLRSGRGYAPHIFKTPATRTILAAGAHLKSAVAVSRNGTGLLSPHIGDLESVECFRAYEQMVAGFTSHGIGEPESVCCDLHPDYRSSQYAAGLDKPLLRVQHHYAHVLSCMLDNSIEGPVLGVVWDGTGFGPDGTVWGGEFLFVDKGSSKRVGCIRPFRLPGGEQAVIDCRRPALGLLAEAFPQNFRQRIPEALKFSAEELRVLSTMLEKKINSPVTTSAGRLFDAVAGLLGLCREQSFEGQGPMMLEALLTGGGEEAYKFGILEKEVLLVDWEPAILSLLEDSQRGVGLEIISRHFHNGLVRGIVEAVRRFGQKRIVLSGGCFQNRYLSAYVISALRAAGYEPYWHRLIPPNDGGIAAGQILAGSFGEERVK